MPYRTESRTHEYEVKIPTCDRCRTDLAVDHSADHERREGYALSIERASWNLAGDRSVGREHDRELMLCGPCADAVWHLVRADRSSVVQPFVVRGDA